MQYFLSQIVYTSLYTYGSLYTDYGVFLEYLFYIRVQFYNLVIIWINNVKYMHQFHFNVRWLFIDGKWVKEGSNLGNFKNMLSKELYAFIWHKVDEWKKKGGVTWIEYRIVLYRIKILNVGRWTPARLTELFFNISLNSSRDIEAKNTF